MKTIYLAFFLIAISISSAQTPNDHTFLRSPGAFLMIRDPEIKLLTVDYKTKDGKTDIIEFAKGFFEGTGVTQVFNEIQSCLTDSEQVLLDLGIGIQDLETKNPEKVKEGIQIIGQAVKIIPEAAKLCQAADKDINKIIKIIKTFSNPLSVIYHAEKSLLINGVQVFDEIMHAIVAYQNKDYEQLGYWVGKAMVTIFLKSGHKDTKSDTIDFVEGFLDGVGATHVFAEIEGCLVDSEKTLADLGIGIEDLESGNPEDIRYGIKLIGKTVKTMIPEAAKMCKAADADVKKIIKLIRTFTNPLSIVFVAGKSLRIDWVEVINETISAIAAYRNQDYKDLGYWIGRAMATIFMQSPLNLRDASAGVQDFFEGFFEGTKTRAAFEQIKEDPVSLLYEAGKNLIIKNEEVMDGVNNAMDAYKEEDFSQLGYWIGKAMDIILVGEDQEKNQGELKRLEQIAH